MRTTLNLDEDLVKEAMAVTGAKGKTEVVNLGLKALVEAAARHRLAALAGKIPEARAPRRRRSPQKS
ncbi:MAG TPA: type II toxin-antitoxin system VapB family antitoxin [Gemmatimonadota bacterium]|nr:type II toxin-antitoxin system VapB family antitoxin [Gemmatimonadota bacterium]